MAKEKLSDLHRLFIRLLVFKLILPSVLVAYILIGSSAYFNAQLIQHDQFILSQFLTQTIDDFLADTKTALSGLIQAAVTSNSSELLGYLETAYSSDPYFNKLIVFNSDLSIKSSYPSQVSSTAPLIARLPIFTDDVSSVSQPFYLPSGHPTVYLVTNLNGRGWLVGELKYSSLESFIVNRSSPLRGREVLLVDSNDQVFVSSSESSFKISEATKDLAVIREFPNTSLAIIKNQWTFLNINTLTQANWKLKIYYPLQYAFGGYLISASIIMLALVLIWIFVLLNFSSEFKNKISLPLIQFNEEINIISKGAFQERTRPLRSPAPYSEINDLANSFNHMYKAIYQRQQALIENEQKYRLLIEQSGDAIYLEQNGKFIIINQKFKDLFGDFKPEEAQPNGIHCLAADYARVFVQEQQLRMLSGEVTHLRFEFEAIDKDKKEISVEVATSVFLYRDQVAIQGVIRDVTQRKKAEQAEKDLRTLAEALRDTASVLTSTLNLDEVMDRILNNVGKVVPCEALNIMMIYNEPKEARIVAYKGYSERISELWLQSLTLPLHSTPNLDWMYKTGKPMVLPDTQADARWVSLPESRWINSYAGAPIKIMGQVIGFLNLDSPVLNFFSPDQADRLQAFSDQAGIAIHNAQLLRDLKHSNKELVDAYETTLQGWSRALELRDYETQGHTLRVLQLTIRLAKRLGIIEPELTNIRYGVLLHDIGKICIPDQILFKKGPLNSREWELMREHPNYAYQLLSPIQYLNSAIEIPYAHHERWDGKGYPKGISGEQIPLAARIFSVIDVWDALLSDRPYHKGLPQTQVISHLREQAGKQLDPMIVSEFLNMLDEEVA